MNYIYNLQFKTFEDKVYYCIHRVNKEHTYISGNVIDFTHFVQYNIIRI